MHHQIREKDKLLDSSIFHIDFFWNGITTLFLPMNIFLWVIMVTSDIWCVRAWSSEKSSWHFCWDFRVKCKTLFFFPHRTSIPQSTMGGQMVLKVWLRRPQDWQTGKQQYSALLLQAASEIQDCGAFRTQTLHLPFQAPLSSSPAWKPFLSPLAFRVWQGTIHRAVLAGAGGSIPFPAFSMTHRWL